MKTLMKILVAVLFVVFVSNPIFAQTEEVVVITDETTVVDDGTTCDGTNIQLQLHDGSGSGLQGSGNGVMSQFKNNGEEFQAAFKATLTEEQLAIIQNLEMTRDEKREALQATFSEAQQELYENHMAEVAERQALRSSNALSEEQMGTAVRNGWQKGRN